VWLAREEIGIGLVSAGGRVSGVGDFGGPFKNFLKKLLIEIFIEYSYNTRMSNFWQVLPKPIFCLAPMEAVTDCVFREMFAKYGKSLSTSPVSLVKSEAPSPYLGEGKNVAVASFVMFTEFVNVDGLLHPEGFKKLKIDLEFTENQRPIVAQLWGRDPEKFLKASKLVADMGFDGIDINMGCPQEKEIAQKTCAYLIREPQLAGEIINAVLKGASGLPVSVKTRIGYSKAQEMENWISHLLTYPISALTLHARTKQEKSKVPAQWEKIKEAVLIRDKRIENREKDKTLIIGNGDIKSHQEGLERIKQTGCDGVMVGRGAFGNPWLFRGDNYTPSTQEKLQVMLEHAELYEKTYSGIKNFITMRKNFKAYASGFEGSLKLRAKLMETNNAGEVKNMIKEFLGQSKF
jgi:nifR3 family TIM-barrel protein